MMKLAIFFLSFISTALCMFHNPFDTSTDAILLKNNPNSSKLTSPDSDGNYRLHRMIQRENLTEACKLMLPQYGLNEKNDQGLAPIHLAVLASPKVGFELVEILIEADVELNSRDARQQTALHLAVKNHRLDIVEKLLSTSIQTDAYDESGYAAIHVAVVNHFEDVLKMLASNTKVNKESDTYANFVGKLPWTDIDVLYVENVLKVKGFGTPLQTAVVKRSLEMVQILLHNSANVNGKGGYKNGTALHSLIKAWTYSSDKSLLAIFDELVEFEIDPTLTDNESLTALACAIQEKSTLSRVFLEKIRKEISKAGSNKWTDVIKNDLAEIPFERTDECGKKWTECVSSGTYLLLIAFKSRNESIILDLIRIKALMNIELQALEARTALDSLLGSAKTLHLWTEDKDMEVVENFQEYWRMVLERFKKCRNIGDARESFDNYRKFLYPLYLAAKYYFPTYKSVLIKYEAEHLKSPEEKVKMSREFSDEANFFEEDVILKNKAEIAEIFDKYGMLASKEDLVLFALVKMELNCSFESIEDIIQLEKEKKVK